MYSTSQKHFAIGLRFWGVVEKGAVSEADRGIVSPYTTAKVRTHYAH